jgi:hypothetical protein
MPGEWPYPNIAAVVGGVNGQAVFRYFVEVVLRAGVSWIGGLIE